jgi:hypothetical protein
MLYVTLSVTLEQKGAYFFAIYQQPEKRFNCSEVDDCGSILDAGRITDRLAEYRSFRFSRRPSARFAPPLAVP